ncbi:MAG: hypothetical protein ABFD89_16945, partial [Bryobacteraceae bacterium]
PQNFRWDECPVSALTTPHNFDAVGIVQTITGARSVGGRGAVYAMCKRDARLYDAAMVIEECRAAEHAAAVKAIQKQ